LVVNCCFYPNNGIATVYAPDYPGGSEIFGQAVLSAPSPNNGYPNTPLNMALNLSSPGTWGATGGRGMFTTGSFVRVTQFDTCCGGVVVDNGDFTLGGIGKAKIWDLTGSNFGDNGAISNFTKIIIDPTTTPPTVTNNGPSVGAFSDSNLGSGSDTPSRLLPLPTIRQARLCALTRA
jgi:hypothetical protein